MQSQENKKHPITIICIKVLEARLRAGSAPHLLTGSEAPLWDNPLRSSSKASQMRDVIGQMRYREAHPCAKLFGLCAGESI
ncbi:hypothetical protein EDD79_10865 [Serpentinicella alkaliphila]|uniref:Uncharacterized protein n=1 Tax=Serpentinicella alkaliphila TaxID=1734049 RepID=A0A4R2SXQ0_9FIRM|nr:hypothetical protein EDD79_10865 [Serpentinicella alkaliphila]